MPYCMNGAAHPENHEDQSNQDLNSDNGPNSCSHKEEHFGEKSRGISLGPQTTTHLGDRASSPLGAHQFGRAASFKISISSACSATSFFKRAFSFSKAPAAWSSQGGKARFPSTLCVRGSAGLPRLLHGALSASRRVITSRFRTPIRFHWERRREFFRPSACPRDCGSSVASALRCGARRLLFPSDFRTLIRCRQSGILGERNKFHVGLRKTEQVPFYGMV